MIRCPNHSLFQEVTTKMTHPLRYILLLTAMIFLPLLNTSAQDTQSNGSEDNSLAKELKIFDMEAFAEITEKITQSAIDNMDVVLNKASEIKDIVMKLVMKVKEKLGTHPVVNPPHNTAQENTMFPESTPVSPQKTTPSSSSPKTTNASPANQSAPEQNQRHYILID